MTIDWTQPVETTEDPPRPVRVLATDAGEQYPIVALISREPILFTKDGHEWPDGCGITLRNVPPPKPEPVLHERWATVWGDGAFYGPFKSRPVEELNGSKTIRIAWMSDGSPVPSEASGEEAPLIGLSDAEFRRLCDNVEAPLIADRDHWKSKAEALQAEVERMKPVVDAAVAWTNAEGNEAIILTGRALMDASRAYQSKQAPAEPVKNCTTCKHAEPNFVCRVPHCVKHSSWETKSHE